MKNYELTTITPVHIGTGEKLSHIDGIYRNRKWRRIDLDKVLASPSINLNELTVAMSKPGFRWQNQGIDFSSEEFFAYVLDCPSDPEEVELREAIKDVFLRPMIPGSSIKGAIRTALLWHLIYSDDDNYNFAVNNLEGQLKRKVNPKWAAQMIERNVLGKSPNYDLLRAMHVSDTNAIDISALEIGLTWTVTLNGHDRLVQKRDNGKEYKIYVEQIRKDQILKFSIKIDDFLFSEKANKELNLRGSKQKSIESIAAVCNNLAKGLIEEEVSFFSYYKGLPEIANFYTSLSNRLKKLPDNAFLVQIGWGTGYRSKTITDLLTEAYDDPEDRKEFKMEVRRKYHLGESRSRRGYYDEREFPKTRRIIYDGEQPKYPLGWVQITQKG